MPNLFQYASQTRRAVVLRHDVEIPQQHPVERMGGGDQLVAVPSEDHACRQRVDDGILDARLDCATPACRRPSSSRSRAVRCPAIAIGASTAVIMSKSKLLTRVDVLAGVDDAQRGVDAELLQLLDDRAARSPRRSGHCRGISILNCSPLVVDHLAALLIFHPASANSFDGVPQVLAARPAACRRRAACTPA